MKNRRILFLAMALILGANFAFSQAKKPAAKKKPAPKAINVYVCTDPKDKVFHKRRTCAGLNKCANEIKFIATASELKKWKRKSCTRCHNK
jgi:hypothetical protein